MTGASNAADFINPALVDAVRHDAVDVYDSQGKSISLSQFAKNYLAEIESQTNNQLNKASLVRIFSINDTRSLVLRNSFDPRAVRVIEDEMLNEAPQ